MQEEISKAEDQKRAQSMEKKIKKKNNILVKQKTGANLITSQPIPMQSSSHYQRSPTHLAGSMPNRPPTTTPLVPMQYNVHQHTPYNYKTINDWNNLANVAAGYQMSRPVYNMNVPPIQIQMNNPRPVLSSQGLQYANLPMQPLLTDANVYDLAARYNQMRTYYEQKPPPDDSPKHNRSFTEDKPKPTTSQPKIDWNFYLTLPRDTFPTARRIEGNPNLLIDEFCKADNAPELNGWVLDMEFGIPKVPVTRVIPTYDVSNNNIVCKNAPDTVHPVFEKCSEGLKSEVLHYYDCVFSTWYKGHAAYYKEKSLPNFQRWVQPPFQCFGMCWP